MNKNVTQFSKTSLGIVFALLSLVPNVNGQNAKAIYDALLKEDEKTINANTGKDELLVSKRGLNNYFAKKVGYYLTGDANTSLNRNFLFLNVGDNDLVFGHNRFKTKSDNRIVSVFTYGFKADQSKSFAQVASVNGLTSNMGATFKYTYYGNGKIIYDNSIEKQFVSTTAYKPGPQKCRMIKLRRLYLHQLKKEVDKEAADFEKLIGETDKYNVDCSTTDIITEKKKEFYEELRDDAEKKYYDKEAELLDECDAKKRVRARWFSLWGFAPFTRATYQVADSLQSLPSEKKGYLAEVNGSASSLNEFSMIGKLFFNIVLGGKYNNTVNLDELNKYTLAEIHPISAHDSSYTKSGSDPVYIGTYKDKITGVFSAQLVYFPKFKCNKPKLFTGNWGISAKFEQKFDGHTDVTNVIAGIPFVLIGKDEDTKVNFELQFKFNDTARWTSTYQNYTLGLSVGLPFSSILY